MYTRHHVCRIFRLIAMYPNHVGNRHQVRRSHSRAADDFHVVGGLRRPDFLAEHAQHERDERDEGPVGKGGPSAVPGDVQHPGGGCSDAHRREVNLPF